MPELRRLAQLIAQLSAVGILRLPADQTRPRRQQRLVDDLDLLEPLAGVARALVRGEQAGVDERVEHRVGRSGPLLAPASRANTDSRSSRPRTARVPCDVTRLRNSSRTSGIRSAPMRSSVDSACCASAPATPPISRYAARVSTPSSRSRSVPQPRRGEGQQRQGTPLADRLRRPSPGRAPRLRTGSRTRGPAAPGRAAVALGPSGPSSVRSLDIGASASCAWQWIRKSSLSDRITWVSASSTSACEELREARSGPAGAFWVNSSSN